jgi:NTE family protein
VLISPAIGDVGTLDFTQKKRCMAAGIVAAQQSMPAIRQAIDKWVAARTSGTAPVSQRP